jgi:hypothetical protein
LSLTADEQLTADELGSGMSLELGGGQWHC